MTNETEILSKARQVQDGRHNPHDVGEMRQLLIDLLSAYDTLAAERDELQSKHDRLVKAIREAERLEAKPTYTLAEVLDQGGHPMETTDNGPYIEIEPLLKEIGDE